MLTSAVQSESHLGLRPLESEDLRRLLGVILALHSPADPRTFPDVVQVACERLLPADRTDLRDLRHAWADRSAHEHRGAVRHRPAEGVALLAVRMSPDGHRLEMLCAPDGPSFRVLLERYARPFEHRDRLTAGVLQAHLGPAFEHARLRAAEWAVAETIRALTVREQEVLALVADGRTNRDIGLALFIDARTVEKHLEHIRAKLGARSRTEAAAMWARGAGMAFAS